MTTDTEPPTAARPPLPGWLAQPGFLYALCLFLAAAVALLMAGLHRDVWDVEGAHWLLPFFLLYGLFTISVGYTHPGVGYVSFDRVAQVASILVLGPVPAAAVNGLASLLWPLQRLREGRPLHAVVSASLHNAGLMTLMILGCGTLYQALSGPVPLLLLDAPTMGRLLVLILAMQLVNELLMTAQLRLSGQQFRWTLHGFAFALEAGAALAGIVVAVVINRMEPALTALLLVVLGLGMFALSQFARLRNRLEALVEERTRVLREKTGELEFLAARDQLTGLFNRRHADEVLRRHIEAFEQHGRPFAVALVDLDHFKAINDRHSHEIGDAVLQRVATLLDAHGGDGVTVARHGGEEFLVCVPDADTATATALCERLRLAVEGDDWSRIAPGLVVSLSAGVAAMQAGLSRSALLNLADARLYRAKHAGRNRVVSS